MHTRWFLAGIALALGTASVAGACAVNIPPASRIEYGKAQGTIEGVAIVSVTTARHIAERQADAHPWQAHAAIVEMVEGSALPETFQFERGCGSSACEWNLPALPQAGDRWVVYFWKDRSGLFRPWLTMPMDEAIRFDPSFAKSGKH
ncbi:hypothetical protein [Erythrobacter sp. MTPC3]|uniref:hypothetical protein n=1 Tax=Erythrobacter sp. MTPC3 TaxID=3056564 RepID=UPI0036F35836